MLSRRLALSLLAPTVLISFVLVIVCASGLVYLNYLHVNVASDLSENVQSTQVAGRLETATERLITRLRSKPSDPATFVPEIDAQNQEAAHLLEEARMLANLENEQILVGQVQRGFTEYLADWQDPARIGNEASLADLLEGKVLVPCRNLRQYNTAQIEQSDRDNQAIVQKLRWGLLAVGLGLPVGGLILGYAVARRVRHSISQLSVRIRDAAGRLNRELGSVTLREEGDLPDLHRQMQGITEEIERIVSQLQQREREVLRAEQLAAVGQVAAGVAHELRNPLTSVKMLVQTGLEGYPPPGLPAEDLSVIETEIRRMEQCIRLFIDFARPPDAEPRRADLVEVIRRSLALVEGRARRQSVQMLSQLPSDPVELIIDPEQIHQVLVNLLLNSLDALPRGGEIHILLRPRNADQSQTGEVEIQIRDDGPGIAPRIRERLFEPFVSSKDTGLGLGLSICKRLVEAHGGTIQGQNCREGGASFTFRLPAATAANAPTPATALPPAVGSRRS